MYKPLHLMIKIRIVEYIHKKTTSRNFLILNFQKVEPKVKMNVKVAMAFTAKAVNLQSHLNIVLRIQDKANLVQSNLRKCMKQMPLEKNQR